MKFLENSGLLIDMVLMETETGKYEIKRQWHGFSASMLGDRTAQREYNDMDHMDKNFSSTPPFKCLWNYCILQSWTKV